MKKEVKGKKAIFFWHVSCLYGGPFLFLTPRSLLEIREYNPSAPYPQTKAEIPSCSIPIYVEIYWKYEEIWRNMREIFISLQTPYFRTTTTTVNLWVQPSLPSLWSHNRKNFRNNSHPHPQYTCRGNLENSGMLHLQMCGNTLEIWRIMKKYVDNMKKWVKNIHVFTTPSKISEYDPPSPHPIHRPWEFEKFQISPPPFVWKYVGNMKKYVEETFHE